MAERRRILYLETSTEGTIGGSHYSLLYLVQGLDQSRFQPVVGFYEENVLLQRFRDAGAEVHILPPPKRLVRLPDALRGRLVRPFARPAVSVINVLRSLIAPAFGRLRWLREQNIDLVHLNNSSVVHGDWVVAAKLGGLPCVAHQRGIRKYVPKIPRLVAARVDRIFCISEAVRQGLLNSGCKPHNLMLLHNAIDPDALRIERDSATIRQEYGIKENAPVIAILGNIKPWKGHECVVRAVGALVKEHPDITCLVVGSSSHTDMTYRQHLESLIKEQELADNIVFTGYQANVADFIAAADLLVHASIEPEPFGRVLIEALSLYTPVVATTGGGVDDIVAAPECGLTYPAGDHEALAHAIRTLLDNPHRMQQMGQAGRVRVEREFHITRNVEKTTSVYDALLESAFLTEGVSRS